MASSSKGSKRGGVGFDELCQGLVKDCSFHLCDLKNKTTSERKQALIQNITDTMAALEEHKEIQCFCIGKTYAKAKDKTFDPMNEVTWKTKGIRERWNKKYKKKHDGLVVLGAVNHAMLDERCNTNGWNHQHYVLVLENALISHYAFDVCDNRLSNNSVNPGRWQKKLSDGYVVYLAFKYKETEKKKGKNTEKAPLGETEVGRKGKDLEEETVKKEEFEGTGNKKSEKKKGKYTKKVRRGKTEDGDKVKDLEEETARTEEFKGTGNKKIREKVRKEHV